jgi:SWI/SNF-related matrix-associated actin-dependent regulator 1 of chromatin subfamily A
MVINPDILASWLPHLLKLGLKTLILDECQYFTNPRSQRTRAAVRLARRTPFCIALSGTPLTNRPSELWPTLHMLRPDKFPSFFSFAQKFCNPKRTFWGWDFRGASNIPELHKLLKDTCMVRRLKSEVLKDLPEKVRRVVPMDLADRREYEQARDNFFRWLQEHGGSGRVAGATKASAIVQIGYLLRLAAQLKCKNVVEWVNRFLTEFPNEKLVLFAVHHKMVGVLQRRVNAEHVTVDGSVIGRRRTLAVEKFRRDPNCRVFIGNIKAAGTGVDGLQGVCSNMAFCEVQWRPGDHIQAEDRLYRIGQNVHVWVNYLIAGGTIEEDLCKIIQSKQEVIRSTLDGKTFDGDMDVFDELMSALGKAKQ